MKQFFDKNTLQVIKLAVSLRLCLILFVLIFSSLIPFNENGPKYNFFYKDAGFKLGNLLSAWDGQWFIKISEQGYPKNPDDLGALASYVDYPLFPLLMRSSTTIFGSPFMAGIAVNFILSVLAAVLIYKVVRLNHPENISHKSVWYFLINPAAIFFLAIYSESLFLCLSLTTIYLAKSKHYLLAGMFGFLSTLTRSVGLLLLIPLFYEYSQKFIHATKKTQISIIISFMLIPLSYFIFMKYSELHSGVPNTYSVAQKYFGRSGPSIQNVIFYLYFVFTNFFSFPVHGIRASQLDVFFMITFLIITFMARRKISSSYVLFNLAFILFTLSSGTSTAVIRYLTVAFPIYLAIAYFTDHKPLIHQSLTIIFLLLQSLFALMYTHWYWVA